MSDTATSQASAPLGESLPNALSNLTPEETKRAEEVAKTINVQDSQAVIAFGSQAQSKIANFSDTVLNQVQSKDSGYVGEVLNELVRTVKDVKVDSLSASDKKVPFFGGLVDSFKKFMGRYEKLSVQIEKIVAELETARMSLLKDITLLDNLYKKNQEYIKELDIYIAAGEIKLAELKSDILPEMQAKAQASNDPLEAQKLQDFIQFINRFEKKVHDLKLSRMVAIQTAPQIRLIQSNNQVLVEKIQSSLMNTIPLWKNQIVIAISIFRQRKALEVQRKVTDATNDLLQKNSAMLKESSVSVAKENERGIVDIETLKKVNADLISTIEDVLKIQEEGKRKRGEAEIELTRMEAELKQKLKDTRGVV
jgi:uncharacterized protein YaaN involved in tellurite resistance